MDADVSRWILEFLLRKCDDDGMVKKALTVIPFPNGDSRLKKIVLLRAIESEVSEASVSETILENLEMIEELDQREGTDTIDSMKSAYCAVAVECTAKYLSVSKPGKYLEAVKRIWRGRVSHMESSGKSHLLTEELKKNGEEVEAAIFDSNFSKKLCRMNTRNDALRLLSVYLGEAWALMGPSFIECAARLSVKDKGVVGSGVEDGIGHDQMGALPNGGVEMPKPVAVSSPRPCPESALNGLLELAVQCKKRVDGNVSDHDAAVEGQVTTPKDKGANFYLCFSILMKYLHECSDSFLFIASPFILICFMYLQNMILNLSIISLLQLCVTISVLQDVRFCARCVSCIIK